MTHYFHGWRRKAGCVMLVMACAFAAAWVRARTVRDWISVPIDTAKETAEYLFQIDNRGISLSKNKNLSRYVPGSNINWRISEPINKGSSKIASLDKETFRHWWGLKVIHLDSMENGYHEKVLWSRSATWTIPHWLIVIPLTLLSAYLLLSNPRSTKQA